MKITKAFVLAAILPALAAHGDVWPSFAGRLILDKPVPMALEAKGALAPWRMMHASGMTERPDGIRDIAFAAKDAPSINGTFKVGDCQKTSSIFAEWTFTPEADVRMEMFGIMGELRMSHYAEGTLVADGETIRLPKQGCPDEIRRAKISRLEIADRTGGRRMAFAFQEPANLFVQYWGDKAMSLRFILPPDDPERLLYKGGATKRLAFTLSGAGKCMKSALSPVTIEAGLNWIPLATEEEILEGSALDFSAMRPTGKPAGKFGRVVSRGWHFEFEGMPGVPQRFYGVNLCNLANYPETQEDARQIARNLARVGYNSIRIHHHDSWCVDKTDPARVRLDENMMRRMDWLVAACIEEGIYISTDLFVSRTGAGITWRSVGVDRDGEMSMADFKRTVYVHEGVYSNFLAFAGNWLSRTNTVTGRRYADEPALAWISLVNEANVDDVSGNDCLSRPGWREAWDKWLAQKKAEQPELFANITPEIPNGLGKNRQGRAYLLFLADVETRFAKRTRSFLNSLGCHALLTDMNNNGLCSAAMLLPRSEEFDYVDTHFYVDHPAFLETDWRLPSWCPNTNPLKGESMGAANVSAMRVFDRPFTISEYNFSGPGRFRGVGGIATGAEAALQDWSGLWRFAWSHNEVTALHPGACQSGYFDIAADPMQMASERASVCIFLRRDATPLTNDYAVTLPWTRIATPDEPIATSAKPDWTWTAWCAKIGAIVGDIGTSRAPFTHAGDFDKAYLKPSEDARLDLLPPGGDDAGATEIGAGAVKIDPERGSFLIETPRTCGIFAENGAHSAGALRISIRDAQQPGANATTIWASSLDSLPLAESRRILVTHLTDLQNTGERYADEAMTVLQNFGRLPYLVRAGGAEVELKIGNDHKSSLSTNNTNLNDNPVNPVNPVEKLCASAPLREIKTWRVYALGTDGRRKCAIPCEWVSSEGTSTPGGRTTGILRFSVSSRQPFGGCMYYEIVRE